MNNKTQTFEQRLRAFLNGKKLFRVEGIAQHTWATDLEHAQKRFKKHTPVQLSWGQTLRYVLTSKTKGV